MTTKYNLAFLQSHLDEIKYYRSEKEGCDLSGKLDYCDGCPSKMWNAERECFQCTSSQEDRVTFFMCAKNYLRIEGLVEK